MTVDDALALLVGPRQEELQGLLDRFFDWGGNTLMHHSRQAQFGVLCLWLEENADVAGQKSGTHKTR